MADDVWSYATGERGAERARHGLEQAGAEFERAAAPLVKQLNAVELRLHNQEVERQHQKELALKNSLKSKSLDSPSLG
jgi:hypothetical protein